MVNKNILTFIFALIILLGIPTYLICTGDVPLVKKFAAYVGLAILLIGSYILVQDNNALRDSCELTQNKPYSFARVQIWWWTLIVIGSFLGVYAVSGHRWDFNETCLWLLGISSVTTTAGRMIDNTQTNDPKVSRHQDKHTSEGLIIDILSDENGLSTHRFQAFIFNLAYGLSFLVEVFSAVKADSETGSFPTYDNTVFMLLGLSSGTYVLMKLNENQTKQEQASPPATPTVTAPSQSAVAAAVAQNDELLDVDDTVNHPTDN